MIFSCPKRYKNKIIINKCVLEDNKKILTFASHCSFHKRISRDKNLVKGYEKYLRYLTRFFERKFSTMFLKLKSKNLLKRIRCFRNNNNPN